MPKQTERVDPLGIFQHFCRKTSKQLKGGSFGEEELSKKIPECQKYWKGGPFSLDRYCMLREKKTF